MGNASQVTFDHSKDVSKAETPVFTNYIGAPLSIEKLDESNYDTWVLDIKLWLAEQGYKNHLTKKANFIPTDEQVKWKKIDAQWCSIIKSIIHPSLKQILCSHLIYKSV